MIGKYSPKLSTKTGPALQFDILHECLTSRARHGCIWLKHCPNGPVETPVFMPVGTQGAMKCITVGQLENMDCRILLGNTYHLGDRPGPEVLRKVIIKLRFLHYYCLCIYIYI